MSYMEITGDCIIFVHVKCIILVTRMDFWCFSCVLHSYDLQVIRTGQIIYFVNYVSNVDTCIQVHVGIHVLESLFSHIILVKCT